jgi:hypothetical protein
MLMGGAVGMSKYNKKGYVSLQFKDPRSGQIYWQAVKIGSATHKNWMRQKKKFEKQQRELKKQLRDAEVVPAPDPLGLV